MVFEADFVSRRDPLVDQGEGGDAASTSFRSRRSRPGPDASAVEISGDLFVTFRDNPAIEAFVKFLATPAAANAWATQGGFAHRQRARRLEHLPGRDRQGRSAGRQLTAKSVVFDMSDEQPASFGSTTGQGEWGLFQTFLKNPSNVTGIAEAARGCGGRGVQEGQVAR